MKRLRLSRAALTALSLLAALLLTLAPAAAQEEGTGEEPVIIRGTFQVTNPFFLRDSAEPYVMLEDEAGFVMRDREFTFPIESQVIAPIFGDLAENPQYALNLPARPQATFVDVDNDEEKDTGVQVFVVAYWANTFGDPFLDRREGFGWSTALSSAIVDPENDDEIVGGIMLVWAPDDQQGFPNGFGDDGLLFTEDDPITTIPAGYNLVTLDQEPFRIWKEAEPEIPLHEGASAVKDYSDMSFTEAFDAFFNKASVEYPFTEMKGIDWEVLYEEYAPRIAEAEADENETAFVFAMRDFLWSIPDGHVGFSFTQTLYDAFIEETNGSLGMIVKDLDDGRLVVTYVLEDSPAADAGIEVGAELIAINGEPVNDALDAVVPWSSPFSSEHSLRLQQLRYLMRASEGTETEVAFQNPGANEPTTATLEAFAERVTWTLSSITYGADQWALPVEFDMIEPGLGYIVIDSFSGDNNLAARIWELALNTLIEYEVAGVIIDLRHNGGGSGLMTTSFAGYFIDEDVPIYDEYYYNENSGEFEPLPVTHSIKPADFQYDGEVALLIGPDCHSACEGFAYMLTTTGRATFTVGMYPTDGIFGEVGLGQYQLPADLYIQMPTGRPVGADGEIIIEGVGVEPTIRIPLTEETVFSDEDLALNRAIEEMLDLLSGEGG